MYVALIGLHAATGIVAFLLGLATLRRERFLDAYLVMLVAMAGFLVLAVASTLAGRGTVGLLLPGALIVLAVVMVGRAVSARRVRPSRSGGRSPAYVHRVGFGLVGLFDAFWVVALLRMGLPAVVVVAVGVAIAVVGDRLLVREARPFTRTSEP